MGNFWYVQEYSGEVIRRKPWLEDRLYSGTEVLKCMHLGGIPCNKLWRLETIRREGLTFLEGLKMSEDDHFYFRFLAACERVATAQAGVTRYLVREESASKRYDFRRLDSVRAFRLVEEFYGERGVDPVFVRELAYDRLYNYLNSIRNLYRYQDRESRRALMDAFCRDEADRDYTEFQDRAGIMELRRKFLRRVRFRALYESNLYAWGYRGGKALKHGARKTLLRLSQAAGRERSV